MAGKDDPRLVALLRAASGDERYLREVAAELGIDAVAGILVAEILFRAEPPTGVGVVLVGLDLTHDGARRSYLLHVKDDAPVTLVEPGSGRIGTQLEYRAVDLIRELFGPDAQRTAGLAAATLVPDAQAGRGGEPPTIEEVARIARAANVVATAIAAAPPALDRLALRYASDKWGGSHRFTPHYDRHFRSLRGQAVRVLEIGIGGYDGITPGGGSLKMWKHYFPRGLVYGIDIFDKSYCDEPRVTTLLGRQDDPVFMRDIAERYGPFDVIIDDGSHLNEHIRASFGLMYRYLRHGGFYVIEDLWTSYWAGYGGDARPGSPGTSVALLKELIDDLHYEEWPAEVGTAPGRAAELVGLHVYHNIAFLEKGVNAEGGIPGWIPRQQFWDDTRGGNRDD